MVACEALSTGAKYADYRRSCPHTQCPSQYGETLERPEITQGLSHWTAGKSAQGRCYALPSEEICRDIIERQILRFCLLDLNHSVGSAGLKAFLLWEKEFDCQQIAAER